MPFRKLFLSRWAALLWAGGILWTAADVADVMPGDTPAPANETATDATGQPVTNDALAALANAVD